MSTSSSLAEAYCEVVIRGERREDAAFELVASGIAFGSTEQEGIQHTSLYLADGPIPSLIEEVLEEFGCEIVSSQSQVTGDYVQQCTALWYPLSIGGIRFRFVADENVKASALDEILLRPGTGFGTGHHPTTGMIIANLTLLAASGAHPKRIVDVGAGSGILSLVCSKLFPQASIEAWEIDEFAVTNMNANLSLNPELAKKIAVCHDAFPQQSESHYDLVIANLYSELLGQYEETFRRALSPGGCCLLSGIMKEETLDVSAYYEKHGWSRQTLSVKGGWGYLQLTV